MELSPKKLEHAILRVFAMSGDSTIKTKINEKTFPVHVFTFIWASRKPRDLRYDSYASASTMAVSSQRRTSATLYHAVHACCVKTFIVKMIEKRWLPSGRLDSLSLTGCVFSYIIINYMHTCTCNINYSC